MNDWIVPKMDGYRMICCDCGLVHDIDFRAIEVLKRNRDGTKLVKTLSPKKYQVEFRIRRNNRSTGQIRRHHDPT